MWLPDVYIISCKFGMVCSGVKLAFHQDQYEDASSALALPPREISCDITQHKLGSTYVCNTNGQKFRMLRLNHLGKNRDQAPSNMNREDAFYRIRSWKPLIHTLKE
jgi:hypothetical protein